MLKLPIHRLNTLLNHIEEDIRTQVHSTKGKGRIHIESVKLLTLEEDLRLNLLTPDMDLHSPLYVCTYACYVLDKRNREVTKQYFMYLIDLLGMCLIGDGLEINSSGKTIRKRVLGSRSQWRVETSYTLEGNQVKGVGLMGSNNPLVYIPNNILLIEFLWGMPIREKGGIELTPYEVWVIKYLGLREVCIDYHYLSVSPLIRLPFMQDQLDEVLDKAHKVLEDIKSLFSSYPIT